jgi:hypothetical protein
MVHIILAIIILAIALGCLSGCVSRQPLPTTAEPDTEWILSQYVGQDEVAVNKRRIAEGW